MSEEGSAEFYKELWMKEQKIRLEQNEFVEMYQSAVMERLKEASAELLARDDATRKLFCGLAKLPDDAPWQDVYETLKPVNP
jgi:3-methyladenine DNA glycosylase/8-oxoguanine DNA glycosylase